MAARWLSSRLLQRVASQLPHISHSRVRVSSYQPLPYSNLIIFGRHSIPSREIQTGPEPSVEEHEVIENSESCTRKTEISVHNSSDDAQNPSKSTTAMSTLKVSPRHDLALVFTCKVCETRSVKTCCRESYEKGVVVVRCGGCNNLHLIADRLGWYGDPGSVEDLLAARGEEVIKGSADSLNLTLEDLAGKKL